MKTILIVDNDLEILEAMSRLAGDLLHELQKGSMEILKTTSAMTALKMSSSRQIDLLITDHQMPGGMSGLQLICSLRERIGMRKVLMSFDPVRLSEALATEMGVDDVIEKPVEEAVLKAILEKYV